MFIIIIRKITQPFSCTISYYKATQCLLTCEYVYVLAGAVLGQKIWIRDSRHHFYIYTQNISWQKSLNTKYLKMREI